jgi:nitrogen regulatory protein PII
MKDSVKPRKHNVERGPRSYILGLGPRTRSEVIEVIVQNTVAKRVIDDVLNVIGLGSSYDGKIFVSDIAESYDIGTKASGDAAP